MSERVPEIMPTILMSKDVGALLDGVRMDVDINGIVEYLSDRGLTDEEIESLTIEFTDQYSDSTPTDIVRHGEYDAKDDRIVLYVTPQLQDAYDDFTWNFDSTNEKNIPKQINENAEALAAQDGASALIDDRITSYLVDMVVRQAKGSLVGTFYNSRSADISDTLVHEFEHRLLRDDEDMQRMNRFHRGKAFRKVGAIAGSRIALGATRCGGSLAAVVTSADIHRYLAGNEAFTTPTQVIGGLAAYALLGTFMKPMRSKLTLAKDFEHIHYLTKPEEMEAREVAKQNDQVFVSFSLQQ